MKQMGSFLKGQNLRTQRRPFLSYSTYSWHLSLYEVPKNCHAKSKFSRGFWAHHLASAQLLVTSLDAPRALNFGPSKVVVVVLSRPQLKHEHEYFKVLFKMFNAATLGISPYRLNPHSIDQSGEDASQVNMPCAVSIISIACQSMLMKKCATFSRVSPHNSTNGKPNIICVVGPTPRTFQTHPDASVASRILLASKSRIGEVEVILDTKLVPQRQASVETCPDFISPTTELQPFWIRWPGKIMGGGNFLHANWLLTVKQAFPRVKPGKWNWTLGPPLLDPYWTEGTIPPSCHHTTLCDVFWVSPSLRDTACKLIYERVHAHHW